MLKLENTGVFGWEATIRGMRNPMNSWNKSDSGWCPNGTGYGACYFDHRPICVHRGDDECIEKCEPKFCIGPNDLKLMKSLSKAGNDHAKFLRMINVTVDITAPLYWWKEFDTYKVGTVANSCSTMHKIHEKEFTIDDFSHEHLIVSDNVNHIDMVAWLQEQIDVLNEWRRTFLDVKNSDVSSESAKRYWWQMIQLLPSSYNQKRTVQLNYQVLKSMYFARKDHKLDEWHILCDWMLTLPYFKEVCVDTNIKEDDERNA